MSAGTLVDGGGVGAERHALDQRQHLHPGTEPERLGRCRGDPGTQGLTALRRRLVAWGPVGIPEAASTGRGQMPCGNAERRIPMRGEGAVSPLSLPLVRPRPALLVGRLMPLARVAVRLIFPLVGRSVPQDTTVWTTYKEHDQ